MYGRRGEIISTQKHRNPLRFLFDLFNSVWLGISLIAAILCYSTLGSAVPGFRQAFELTEFQYFNHWVFAALLGLFCISLTVTTVCRIRFNLGNAGVLGVHSGLLILCAGSVLYFGRKIEGDVLLRAPSISIISRDRLRSDPGSAMLDALVAVKGKVWQANMPMIGGRYRLEVVEVHHEDMTTASNVLLEVTVGDEPPRMIEISQSDPAGGLVSLNDQILLQLSPANITDQFYDESTPMLRVTHQGRAVDLELASLPYYKERFVPEAGPIWYSNGAEVTSRRHRPLKPLEYWEMPISPDGSGQAGIAGWPIEIEIDGYLPYAQLERVPVPGGSEFNPIILVELSNDGGGREHWLTAQVPAGSLAELADGSSVEYRWIGAATEIDRAWKAAVDGRHVLEVYVKDKDLRREYDVAAGQTIEVEGSDYTLRVEQLLPSWPLMTAGFEGARTPAALVWVESPNHQFQRSLLERYPGLSQDRDRQGRKILATGGPVDENIEIRYTDASVDRFVVFAGDNLAPTVVHTAPGGQRTIVGLEVGRPFRPGNGASLVLREHLVRPRMTEVPRVIPPSQRRPFSNVRRNHSLMRVVLRSTIEDWSQHIWLPYSLYNADHQGDTPATIVPEVPGLGEVSLVYGRTPRRLPGRITLERLQTDFYPGRQRPSAWTSHIRYEDPDSGRIVRTAAYLNHTARFGPWRVFQATAAGDHESWTGLGVGNRDGVLTMLAGCTLISLGMIYAFAVKPILIRRRRKTLTSIDEWSDPPEDPGMLVRPSPPATSRPPEQVVAAIALVFTIMMGAGARSVFAADGPAGAIWRESGSPAQELLAIQEQGGLDSDTLGALVIQYNARYSTVEAWARNMVDTICGPGSLLGLDPLVAAVELMFNGQSYNDQPIILIKDKALRRDVIAHPVELSDEERSRILRTGMVSFEFLNSPEVVGILATLASDARRKKPMDRLSAAMEHFNHLERSLTIVPSPTGRSDGAWFTVDALFANAGVPSHLVEHHSLQPVPGVSQEAAREILRSYLRLRESWLGRDVAGINAAIGDLERVLPTLAPPGVYPSAAKRRLEVTYHRLHLMRWAWASYIAAFFVSIFAVATRYRWVRAVALVFLLGAVGLHGCALGLRWYVVGRIPVANMYEAVVSSTWLGAMFGLVLEVFTKKRIYLLAAGLLGFFGLALPELNIIHSNIETMMPILDDVMLRIHTVLIIGSYAVITLAFAVANCYLVVSAFRDRTIVAQATIGAELGAILCLIMARVGLLADFNAAGVLLCFGSFIVGGGLSLVGGCAAVLGSPGPASATMEVADWPIRSGVLAEFDLSHRVLLYTATVALFVGLVLGAVWADYSWGRPWGWDPKEVFALNTWLVYAILIHLRLVTRRRALWMSVLSVCGFATMQFNWWVVNFYIVGLHSYA